MTISDLISIAALLFSVIAFVDSKRSSRKVDDFYEKQSKLADLALRKEKEQDDSIKRADVSARIFKEGKDWRVKAYNMGPATARNVRIGSPPRDLIKDPTLNGKLPMLLMERGQSVESFAHVHMGSPMKEMITLLWDDDSASDRSKDQELTL